MKRTGKLSLRTFASLLAIGCLVAILRELFVQRQDSSGKGGHLASPEKSLPNSVHPIGRDQAARGAVPIVVGAASPENAKYPLADEFMDPDRFKTDRLYQIRIKKHLNIRHYQNSPARDSSECERIKALLQNRGVGLEAVGEAYQATWDFWEQNQAMEAAPEADRSSLELLRNVFRDTAISRLRIKYGIDDDGFYRDLFSIRPIIPFGRKDLTLRAGERLQG